MIFFNDRRCLQIFRRVSRLYCDVERFPYDDMEVMEIAPKVDELVKKAEKEQLSYTNFLLQLFEEEALHREK